VSGQALRIEIHQESRAASEALRSELSPVLEQFGLPHSVGVDDVGPPRIERRSLPEAVNYAVHELTIRLADAVTTVCLGAIADAIKRWRRETGNTTLDVPIFGPNEEVLTVVKRDGEAPVIEFHSPPND
jgi:hypothetical protein